MLDCCKDTIFPVMNSHCALVSPLSMRCTT
jgi:hypothetical protein